MTQDEHALNVTTLQGCEERGPAGRPGRKHERNGGCKERLPAWAKPGRRRPSGRAAPRSRWRDMRSSDRRHRPTVTADQALVADPGNGPFLIGASDTTFMCSRFGQRSSMTCIPAIAHNAVSESRPTPPAALCAALSLTPGVGRRRRGSVSELRCGFPSDCGLSSAIQEHLPARRPATEPQLESPVAPSTAARRRASSHIGTSPTRGRTRISASGRRRRSERSACRERMSRIASLRTPGRRMRRGILTRGTHHPDLMREETPRSAAARDCPAPSSGPARSQNAAALGELQRESVAIRVVGVRGPSRSASGLPRCSQAEQPPWRSVAGGTAVPHAARRGCRADSSRAACRCPAVVSRRARAARAAARPLGR